MCTLWSRPWRDLLPRLPGGWRRDLSAVREGELDPTECAPPRAVCAPGRERGRLVRRVRQNVRSEAGAAAPPANTARRALVTCAHNTPRFCDLCTQHAALLWTVHTARRALVTCAHSTPRSCDQCTQHATLMWPVHSAHSTICSFLVPLALFRLKNWKTLCLCYNL